MVVVSAASKSILIPWIAVVKHGKSQLLYPTLPVSALFIKPDCLGFFWGRRSRSHFFFHYLRYFNRDRNLDRDFLGNFLFNYLRS